MNYVKFDGVNIIESISGITTTLIYDNKRVDNPKEKHFLAAGYIKFDATVPTGYTTNGYEIVDGVLKYKLILNPYPDNWPYLNRHIRVTLSKDLCKGSGDYASFVSDLYVEGTPFIKDNNNIIIYFEELNLSDGFSLNNNVISHIDGRLSIEQFGNFVIDGGVIKNV